MKYSFPKKYRLRSKDEFSNIRQSGRVRVFGNLFAMFIIDKSRCDSGLKLGISVPKRYGNAVLRNRFKRIVREVVRHDGELKSLNCSVIVGPNLRSPTEKLLCIEDVKKSFDLFKCVLNS